MKITPKELELRRRHRNDFTYYAPRALKIRTKAGTVTSLKLNAAQKSIHTALEAQLAETGRIRALILKGRQQGASTYVEARFFWKVTHRRGVRAFILTHMDDASTNLFGMAKRFYEHCPAALKPSMRASNAKELIFDKLDSGYRVATAGSKGAGRSDTLQYFHGSEVAYWPNADEHVAGALQAVPDLPNTEVIFESTSAGPTGLFYDLWQKAAAGEGDFRPIFIPWFWETEYTRPVPVGFALTGEEADYQERHGVSLEAMAWRRAKVFELNGAHKFRQEYPATPQEAFESNVVGALWTSQLVQENRVERAPPLRRVVVAIDPSGGDTPGHDEVGIVVAGQAYDGQVYVLEDLSGIYSPDTWGSKAVSAYYRYEADRIIGEANFGGQMVSYVIQTADHRAAFKLVTASRGKAVRAEPVAALYEQGRVHHVGRFTALEAELTTWTPASDKSPNRLDALVWAVTELVLIEQKGFSFG
jgi:hypothetical protein